jgi:hypothetical protein
MRLYERVFSYYMACLLVVVLIVIGVPATIFFRTHGVPLVVAFFLEGVPLWICAMAADPSLAITALLVFLFLWSATLMLINHEESPNKDHRRGRVVESRRSDEFEDLLRVRRAARSKNVDKSEDHQFGVRRASRFGSFNNLDDDDD